ncbi:MAG: Trehalose/maltose import ATP-binding protein MalK [Candidatus Methanocomedens sp.]|nr:MAG: Trehalose/maltose import ATP-binding protein MalK [ANME-2 cluster archaeon]
MIELEDVTFSYSPADPVLDGINVRVGKGEYLGVMGDNGSGKSTLARLITGLLLPQKGTIRVNGISTGDRRRLLEIHRSAGMVFQNPDAQAIGETVEEDLVFGLENLGLPVPEIYTRIEKYLDLLGIRELRYRNIRTLSGGQKQLVNLAAVMVMEPECIILDEPVSMVDARHRKIIFEHIARLNREGTAIVHITHDPEELTRCHRLIVLSRSGIIHQGTTHEVFNQLLDEEKMDIPVPFAISRALGLTPVLTTDALLEELCRLRSGT